MNDIINNKYIKKNVTKTWLLQHNFRYSKAFSSEESDVYTYRFPVYKYEKFTVLECELSIFIEDGNVTINVYDYGTNDKYAPFYYLEYGNYDKMLKTINEKIIKELTLLGIEQLTNKEGKK